MASMPIAAYPIGVEGRLAQVRGALPRYVLTNHVQPLGAEDCFTVPTMMFKVVFVPVVLGPTGDASSIATSPAPRRLSGQLTSS